MSGLISKRDELIREIDDTEAYERRLRSSLEHIEQTIRLCRQGEVPRRYRKAMPVQYAESGSVLRHVTRMLRKAEGPITAADITNAWITKEGLIASHGTFVILRKRIGSRLNKLKTEGVIRRVKLDGPYDGWEFVP